ncbi:SDR family NAD(P)-dependent oxidoreductase [Labrys okinawensis]|uniref:SDR family NAD(P)-dependent oxidoreductase n=1 Tax=Labrys okinawensis TaxID=346911 RepID=UPI0039BD6EB5
MTRKLEGKFALVTGGSTGIGFGIARQFAREGATVFVTGRRQAELDAAVKEIGPNAIGIRNDISDLADLDRLYATVRQTTDHLDIVAANAGGGEFAPLGTITEEHFDRTFAINVKGTLFTVQKALPLLREGASIILTSSTSTTRALPAFSVYAATKAAIRNFARHWMLDLKDRHIRVNAISPGPTTTPGLQGLTSNEEEWKQFQQLAASQVPMGRIGEPEEIGKAAVFLASDDASFINGIELFVDGGMAQI